MPRKIKQPTAHKSMPVLQPDAAGVDIGATEIYVAVPADRDPHPVRRFATFTADLQAIADWLARCRIRTVAAEATGVYWIPLFQILEERGFEVCLVNARHVKHVAGRKSDVSDCQWLQFLHSVGLLRASFRPAQSICSVRTLWRHRAKIALGGIRVSRPILALTGAALSYMTLGILPATVAPGRRRYAMKPKLFCEVASGGLPFEASPVQRKRGSEADPLFLSGPAPAPWARAPVALA